MDERAFQQSAARDGDGVDQRTLARPACSLSPCVVACALSVTLAGACADVSTSEPSSRTQAVVYGADDRRDLYQLAADDPLRESARSVAAVIPRSAIGQGPDGEPLLLGDPLMQTFSLCPDQRFAHDLGAAECTAFLIDDSLLATAGHCFVHAKDCQDYVLVFDYVRTAPGAPVTIAAENIFDCRRIQVRRNETEPGVSKRDYGIVEITRRASGRPALPLRSEPVTLREPLSVISAVSGLPLKFDRGARVLDVRAHVGDFIRIDSDTAHGSSGAPVFDAAGQVVGVAVRGRTDYVLNEQAGCYVENVLSPPELVGPGEPVKFPGGNELYSEEASLLGPALATLCERGYPSPRLCGRAAVCGDQSCSGDETFESCPGDCTEAPPSRAPLAGVDAGREPVPSDANEAGPTGRRVEDGCAVRMAADGRAWLWLCSLALSLLGRRARLRSSSLRWSRPCTRSGSCRSREHR